MACVCFGPPRQVRKISCRPPRLGGLSTVSFVFVPRAPSHCRRKRRRSVHRMRRYEACWVASRASFVSLDLCDPEPRIVSSGCDARTPSTGFCSFRTGSPVSRFVRVGGFREPHGPACFKRVFRRECRCVSKMVQVCRHADHDRIVGRKSGCGHAYGKSGVLL